LRRAIQPTRAARDRFALHALDVGAAHGALRRQLDLARRRRTALRNHLHDFRYDVAGAAYDDRVADAYVLAPYLVHVVQRRIAHRHAADEHRLQARDGRQRTGPADLELDIAHDRVLLVRRKLVCDRPARRARDVAELALLHEP